MKSSIYAVVYKNVRPAVEIRKELIGTAVIENGCISARKYNELHRAAEKVIGPRKKGQYWRLQDEAGRTTIFKGYPAYTDGVMFVDFETKPYSIETISREEAAAILDYYDRKANGEGVDPSAERLGRFLFKEDGKYIAIDNTGGDAWTEEFDAEESARDWLRDYEDED